MIKKITFILAVFLIISMLPVFADDGSADGANRIKSLAAKRVVAIKNYQEAKLRVQTVKTEYESARTEWANAKQKYIASKNSTNETAFAIEKGKLLLNRTVERMISHLELVKSKVNDMKVLGDSERANITAELDSDIAALSALQEEIPGIKTKSNLRDVSAKIKNAWHDAQKGVARAAGKIELAKTSEVIGKAENMTGKIQEKIDAFKAKGLDTANLESLLSEYNSQITLARTSLELAKAKFQEGNNEAARIAFKDVRDRIKEAQKTLRDIVKEGRKEVKEQLKKNKSAE